MLFRPPVLSELVMPLTQLEKDLRLLARELMAKGQLPTQVAPSKMWGAYGTGKHCNLCGQPIRPDEVEYELEYGVEPVTHLRFHIVCHSVWQLEVARQDYLTKNG